MADDIFLLSRSTVPAQRASMLGFLAKARLQSRWKGGWTFELFIWDDYTADIKGIELHLAPDVISSTQPEQLLPIDLSIHPGVERASGLYNDLSTCQDSALRRPMALGLLIILASASRSGASTLLELADALLRFATLLPDLSPLYRNISLPLLLHFCSIRSITTADHVY
ncbi:hypothetical protein BKA82DRAFT_27075 [Pisolithus tinctorius]|uniref:Uncharacterized protein n=1 Tax=Pisolithus tinctorius Marx 270 TaxID=870435 RepID=A0A0C3J301_PISTI|nr:hypothetical protein BKA82DRAFT_27075 [Pisolithus tinctorius]KIO03443.1 hypothetical protein M404DRAFT_27075 [Pisolithus tinctorius Marx 270]